MAIEYELKFKADDGTLSAIEAAFSGTVQKYKMQTTYYDTPDGALSVRHYTLRRRLENGISVCTLKTPAGKAGRRETEVECDSIQDAIPELCKLGAPKELHALLQKGLLPICGAEFSRTAITLRYESSVLELALDRGVLHGGDKSQPLCEVEVELKDGSMDEADLFALALAQRFSLVPEPHSKFRRAQALYKGEPL